MVEECDPPPSKSPGTDCALVNLGEPRVSLFQVALTRFARIENHSLIASPVRHLRQVGSGAEARMLSHLPARRSAR